MWAACLVGIIFGYKPPKRRTAYDELSWLQKLSKLDLLGSLLLTAAVAFLLAGLGLGGSRYGWTNSDPITFQQAQSMPYLQAVIKETLRIHPAVGTILPRKVPRGGVTLGGTFFPEGVCDSC